MKSKFSNVLPIPIKEFRERFPNRIPTCSVTRCKTSCQYMGKHKLSTGHPIFRKICGKHHMQNLNRPKEINPRICKVSECYKVGQHLGSYYKTGDKKGQPRRRGRCSTHHYEFQATKKGMSANQWLNSFHSYKKYRKEYCENIDSRLGFKCTTTIIDMYYQLEVDHIDNNHDNNTEGNHQTLCACCHRIKTKYDNNNNQDALDLMLEVISG